MTENLRLGARQQELIECEISGCEYGPGYAVTDLKGKIREVCRRCMEELTGIFGWEFGGILR